MWLGPLGELCPKVDKIAVSEAWEGSQGNLCEYSGVGERESRRREYGDKGNVGVARFWSRQAM